LTERLSSRAADIRVGSTTDGLTPISVAERQLGASWPQWLSLAAVALAVSLVAALLGWRIEVLMARLRALTSISPWVLLRSGERLRVQLTNIARRPLKSMALISGSVMGRQEP